MCIRDRAESLDKAEQPQKVDAKASEAANPKAADQTPRKKSKRPERSKDGGRNDKSDKNKVVGMGDHVPDFMTRPIRSQKSA